MLRTSEQANKRRRTSFRATLEAYLSKTARTTQTYAGYSPIPLLAGRFLLVAAPFCPRLLSPQLKTALRMRKRHTPLLAIFNWSATPARSACRSFSLSLLILPFFFHPTPFKSLFSSRETPISRLASTSPWLVSPGNTAATATSRGPNKLATIYLGTLDELWNTLS